MALDWLWPRAWSSDGAVAPRRVAWQAWHFVTSTFTAWDFVTSTFTLCGRRQAWHFMALGWLWRRAWTSGGAVAPRRFVSQAWHFVTSTFTLPVGVALRDIHLHFAWQAWHFVTSTFTLCGSVALRDIHFHFVWQARHLVTSTCTLRGRRGTW